MHLLVKLAKDTVEHYINNSKIIAPPSEPCAEMKLKAGVFVSIKKKGELRGCIGTFQPAKDNVALEIIHNSVSASTLDPRFPPVESSELKDLEYSVDLLSEPERVDSNKELDPKKYGVIVQSGNHRGLLLPDLEGVETVDEQVNIAYMKAGICPGDEVELYRFEVKRFT